MADSDSLATEECSSCGALLDVTDEQPLALCHCPACGNAMRVRRKFNHFELLEILGAGGMGAVYRAHDTTLHRDVALKLLRAEHSQSQELIASFSKEAALTASINHPHVVKVYSTGTDRGIFYIAMELVDRGSLDELMQLQGKIGEAQLLEVGIQVAQGLQAAYQRGLIHRDVKPGNILFADAHNAKIVDFGLAVLQEQANKDGGPVWGTPYYVAPEKLETPPREDFRSDMYSLGATLFHGAAGRPPFDGETASMVHLQDLKNHIVSVQSFAPELSRTTSHVLDKMLHRFPQRRYASYEDLITNLQYARDELQREAGQMSRPVKRKFGAVLTLFILLALAAGGFVLFHKRDQFLHRAPKVAAAATPSASEPDAASLDQKALNDLAAENFAAGATALHALDAREDIPQPLRNWITMHAALGDFLAGKSSDAQTELQKIVERKTSSGSPDDEKLAKFFTRTAEFASDPTPQPANVATSFDATNHEAFALLLLGLKDWNLGAFDEADPLLATFRSASLDGSGAWLKPFQPIAANLLVDLGVYRGLATTAETDIPGLEQAIAATKQLRAKQKIDGQFTAHIASLEEQLTKQLAAAKDAKMTKDTELDAADGKLIADALRTVGPAYLTFRFTDATKVFDAVHCETLNRQAEVAGWLQRTEWLTKFKRTLIDDINVTGYPQPLLRRTGTTVLNLSRASDASAEMKTPYGFVPVPWSDLTVESFAMVAQAFLRTASPAEAGDRAWRLGVFLYAFGKKPEGLIFLRQGAAAQPDYQPYLALFPEG